MTSRFPSRLRTIWANSLYARSVKPPAAAMSWSSVSREVGEIRYPSGFSTPPMM